MRSLKPWWERKQDRLDAEEERIEQRTVASYLRYVKGHGDASKVVEAALEMVGGRLARLDVEPALVDNVKERRGIDAIEVYTAAAEALAVAHLRLAELEDILAVEWREMIEAAAAADKYGEMETRVRDVGGVRLTMGYQPTHEIQSGPPNVGSSVMKGA